MLHLNLYIYMFYNTYVTAYLFYTVITMLFNNLLGY